MPIDEIIDRIMCDVDRIVRVCPKGSVSIAVTYPLFVRIVRKLTCCTTMAYAPPNVELFGIPMEIMKGKEEEWIVGLRGTAKSNRFQEGSDDE